MRFLADENLDGRIYRAIRGSVDIVRVQDTEVYQADDPTVLEWAAQQNRILLTHDIRTMPGYAYERVREGKTMLGVIAIRREASIGKVIEDLQVVIGASDPTEYEYKVVFLPL